MTDLLNALLLRYLRARHYSHLVLTLSQIRPPAPKIDATPTLWYAVMMRRSTA
jgi:hypothetical protein